MSVTTITIKAKKNSERIRLDSRVFYDKPGTVSTKTTGNVVNSAQNRIGIELAEQIAMHFEK